MDSMNTGSRQDIMELVDQKQIDDWAKNGRIRSCICAYSMAHKGKLGIVQRIFCLSVISLCHMLIGQCSTMKF